MRQQATGMVQPAQKYTCDVSIILAGDICDIMIAIYTWDRRDKDWQRQSWAMQD